MDVLVTEEILEAIFQPYGEIGDITVKKHLRTTEPPAQSGYAFIYYYSITSAVNAVKDLKKISIETVNYECSLSYRSEQIIQQIKNFQEDEQRKLSSSSYGMSKPPRDLQLRGNTHNMRDKPTTHEFPIQQAQSMPVVMPSYLSMTQQSLYQQSSSQHPSQSYSNNFIAENIHQQQNDPRRKPLSTPENANRMYPTQPSTTFNQQSLYLSNPINYSMPPPALLPPAPTHSQNLGYSVQPSSSGYFPGYHPQYNMFPPKQKSINMPPPPTHHHPSGSNLEPGRANLFHSQQPRSQPQYRQFYTPEYSGMSIQQESSNKIPLTSIPADSSNISIHSSGVGRYSRLNPLSSSSREMTTVDYRGSFQNPPPRVPTPLTVMHHFSSSSNNLHQYPNPNNPSDNQQFDPPL
jgi:hypothetical protein